MKRIVAYARDPGSANMTIAACAALAALQARDDLGPARALFGLVERETPAFDIYAGGPAHAAWTRAGAMPRDPADVFGALPAAAGLVTGLDDVDDPIPRPLWRRARELGVPSAAFCDNNINLGIRLKDGLGPIAPDLVFALGDAAREEIVKAGVSRDRVPVIANLHLDALAARPRDHAALRASMRERWGIDPAASVWLYAGVVRRELHGLREIGREDEVEALRALSAKLDARGDPNLWLVIRPHPRDSAGKYSGMRASRVGMLESNAGTSIEALLGADVVVSLSEAILDEARVLGRSAYHPDEVK